MKDYFVSSLKNGNTFYGIEYVVHNSKPLFHVLGLKKTRKHLEICFEDTLKTLDEITNKIGKDNAISLVINSEDVLTKKVKALNTNDDKLLREVFPNLNTEVFFYEVLRQQSTAFVSICRKENIDNLLKQFEEQNLSVVDVTLGVLSTSTIIKFISDENLLTSSTNLILSDNEISSVDSNTETQIKTYDCNGLDVKSSYILPFSSALKCIIQNAYLSNNLDETINTLKDNFTQKRYFKLLSRGSIALLLVILLVNFFVFNHYFNEVNHLKDSTQLATVSKQNLDALSKKVLKSEQTLNDVLKNSGSKSTFYINATVLQTPNSVLLTEINYQPVLRRIEADKAIQNDVNSLVIEGESLDGEAFSEWLRLLESLNWSTSVDIISYEGVSNTITEFEIIIKLNE